MKIESAIHTNRDSRVVELTVRPADQFGAKDLLLGFEDLAWRGHLGEVRGNQLEAKVEAL